MKIRMRSVLKFLIPVFALLVPSAFLWAGGQQEADSSERGAYIAEQGQIIPPDEVNISSYIGSVDYEYPDPSGDLGVTLYSGHRQVFMSGQEEIIQIGIQGKRMRFEDLPVLNLAFVLDISGSMSEKDKIQWAKEAFDLFLRRLRRQDIISVVAFADSAQVLLPATRVGDIDNRKRLLDLVNGLISEGQSNMESGLKAGYLQVLTNHRPSHVNRVLLISDGLGINKGASDLVLEYKEQGISLSTITVGMNCDLNMMVELSKNGAGSSRFISNRKKMEEIFSTDLDRMVVPIAYDLDIELNLSRGVEIIDTWGYDFRLSQNTIHYSLSALHHRDYETILVNVRLPGKQAAERVEIARLNLDYIDREGTRHTSGPYSLKVDYTGSSIAEGGISDPTVLKAGTILHTAQGLETIGFLYFSTQMETERLNRFNRLSWHNLEVLQEDRVDTVLTLEKAENSGAIRAKKQRCLDLSEALKKEISNTHMRLGEDIFSDELTIVKKYIEILGGELNLGEPVISRMLADEEILIQEIAGGTRKQLEDLAEELTIGLEARTGGSIAFFGFTSGVEENTNLQVTVDRITRDRLSRFTNFRIVGEPAVEEALTQMDVSRQSLLDNTIALKAGSLLRADFLLIGRIVEMPNTTVVFGKLIDGSSGTVESVAQIILHRGD